MKILKLFYKLLFKLKIWFYLTVLSNNSSKINTILKQPCLFQGKGKINIDKNAMIGVTSSALLFSTYSYIEARNKSSYIEIGENTYINNNCCIISDGKTIKIGENCRIGINFQCFDSDFHGLNIEDRDNQEKIKKEDVLISNNVFIGNNVIITKGVKLGNGVVVGAGSIVTKSFDDNVVIAGNPAKIVSKIN